MVFFRPWTISYWRTFNVIQFPSSARLCTHCFLSNLQLWAIDNLQVLWQVWATLTTSLFYKTEIEGLENLPRADEGAVYVANHQSFLDIYTLFQLGRPFKFISKTSNFLIPLIGWSMYLTGHIPLKRMDKKSQLVGFCGWDSLFVLILCNNLIHRNIMCQVHKDIRISWHYYNTKLKTHDVVSALYDFYVVILPLGSLWHWSVIYHVRSH